MKVLFCAFDGPGYTGGPNSWLRRLVTFLTSRGVSVRVLLFLQADPKDTDFSNYPLLNDFERQGVDFRRFYFWETTENKVRWIFDEVRDFAPDVFVPNVVVAAYWAARWIREAGIPTVGVLHSDDDFHHALLERYVAEDTPWRLTDLVCVSRLLEGLASGKAATTRVHRISYGVNVPDRTATFERKPLKMLYVGRFEEEQKRISDVARAMCRAANACDATGTLVGSGNAVGDVERILKETGNRRVELGGLIENTRIQQFMADFHVLVLLSDYEGLPIALMEAMAVGLVPVCTRMGSGIPELVLEHRTGLLVDDREDGFVDTVRALASDTERWERLSTGARSHIQDGYSETACHRAWYELLSDCAAKSAYDGRRLGPGGADWTISLPEPDSRHLQEDFREPAPMRRALRVARHKLASAARSLGKFKR